MITDPYLNKNGKHILKAKLLYIDESPCDGCDEMKPCAIIQGFHYSSLLHLCKDCLQELIDFF